MAEKVFVIRREKKKVCQKWDSNPRPHSGTRNLYQRKLVGAWVWRLRPLGHPDRLALLGKQTKPSDSLDLHSSRAVKFFCSLRFLRKNGNPCKLTKPFFSVESATLNLWIPSMVWRFFPRLPSVTPGCLNSKILMTWDRSPTGQERTPFTRSQKGRRVRALFARRFLANQPNWREFNEEVVTEPV